MVHNLAGRIVRTLLPLARVHTLEVLACQVLRAALVSQADRHRGAAAVCADAVGPVVLHLAFLAGCAQTGAARVLAGAGVAGLVGRTVAVLTAFHLAVRAGQCPLLVDHEAVLALTRGLVVGHHALLVGVAAGAGTRVEALGRLPVAGRCRGAVRILLAAAHNLRQRIRLLVGVALA